MDNTTNNPPVTHSTQYSSLSDIEVKSLFASNIWNDLSPQKRLDACQEVENRLAAERGTDSRSVFDRPMEGKAYGYQSGDYIAINTHLLEKGSFEVQYTDFQGRTQTDIVPVDAPSWEILSTIYHEDTHGIWEDQKIMPETYIKPSTNSLLYYLQSCEKAAFLNEQKLTLETIEEVSRYNKEIDPQALVYLETHSGNEYQEILAEAQKLFNDPNIEQTLNQYIADNDKGIIPQNPSQSYVRIDDLYIQQNIRNYFGNQQYKGNELNATQQNQNISNQVNLVDAHDNTMATTQMSASPTQPAAQINTLHTTSNDVQSVNTIANDGSTISNSFFLGVISIDNDGATISNANSIDGVHIENDGAFIDYGYSAECDNNGYSAADSGYSSSDSNGQSNDNGQSIE